MNSVIFDIDGTLADCEHRRHFIATKPKNWPAFFKAMHKDTVIENIAIYARHYYENTELKVIIVTARPNDYSDITIKWLSENNIKFDEIFFRSEKDSRDDAIVKAEILEKIREKGYNPIRVYDDRPKVIRMWKQKGLEVIDCGKGIEF